MCKHCKQVTTRICRKSEFHGETAVKAVDLMIPGGAGPGQRAGNRQIFHRVFVLSPGAAQPALCAEGSDFFLELVEAGGMGCEMTSLPWKLWDYLGSQDVFESESTVQWDCSCFTAGLGSEFTENWEVGYETHILIGVKLLALKAPNDFLSLAHDRAESTNLPAFVRDWHRMPQKRSFLCLASCAGNLHLHWWQRFSRADLRRDCDHARPALRKCVTTCHDWEKMCVGPKIGPPSGGSYLYQPKSSWKLEASWSFTDVTCGYAKLGRTGHRASSEHHQTHWNGWVHTQHHSLGWGAQAGWNLDETFSNPCHVGIEMLFASCFAVWYSPWMSLVR